jgi:hypothetical protein
MQITHEEAHKLIQFHVDGALIAQQKHLLTSHLDVCVECRKYADSIENVDLILRPLLHRQWDREPLPLSIGVLRAQDKSVSERMVVATRIAALAVVFLGFFFGAWNFSISTRRTPTPFFPNIPVIPTPFTSTVTVDTESTLENCAMTSYVVEKNDTLASIAFRFSVSIDDIMQVNAIRNQTVNTGEHLSIPVCNPTPTNPATAHTTTFTPARYSTTITPDG